MADTLDPKYLDKRTAERYLRSGQLDEGTYKRHIEELPDVAEKSATVATVMDGEEFFDDEADDEADDEGDEGEEAAADDTEDGDDEDEDEDEAAGDAAEDTENP